MRNALLACVLLIFVTSSICCAQESVPLKQGSSDTAAVNAPAAAAQEPADTAASPLVYLSVASAEVSSFDMTPDWAPPPNPKATLDGDLLSRWSSGYGDNQWIVFDFGSPKTLSKVIVFWEAAYAVDYDILTSLDNQTWTTLLSQKDRKGGIEQLDVPAVKTRYVKIVGLKRFNPDWGFSVWETAFLGPEAENAGEKGLEEVYPELVAALSGKEAEPKKTETAVPSPGALTPDEFQKGVCYTSWGRTELGTSASDATLEYLYKTGVRHISIMIVWLQDTNEEKQIAADPKDTPDDAALIHCINKAHALGMKVMLKPHADVRTGQWRGDIIPSKEWFASYKEYILRYAKLSAAYNAESYSIGTELVNTTLPNWLAEWEDIIREVRSVYSGPLIYGANWDEFKTVPFWDKLDYVGIDAYFPLASKKDAPKEELINSWKAHAAAIDAWLKEKQLSQPVVFAEVGYCSADGTTVQPWSTLSNLPEECVDQQEQADAMEAMFVACTEYPWFKGLYWWNYFPQERWSPLSYTIRGKKVEAVFAEWLHKL